MSDLPVTIDEPEARPPIELVHCSLSSDEVVIHDPDWQSQADQGESLELYIQADHAVDARVAR